MSCPGSSVVEHSSREQSAVGLSPTKVSEVTCLSLNPVWVLSYHIWPRGNLVSIAVKLPFAHSDSDSIPCGRCLTMYVLCVCVSVCLCVSVCVGIKDIQIHNDLFSRLVLSFCWCYGSPARILLAFKKVAFTCSACSRGVTQC